MNEPIATGNGPDNAVGHEQPKGKKGFSGMQVFGICLLVMAVTVGITSIIVWRYAFPKQFEPVALNQREQVTLEEKIERLGISSAIASESADTQADTQASSEIDGEGRLQPKAYSEKGASRDVSFSERELNALLASNTNMAQRLAIDLSDDLASARLLVPMDKDFPVLGGKTLRVNAGLEVAFRDGRPVAILRGVSLMGVPLPNAWLGNLKNVDLISEFGGDPGFWNALAAGVEYLEIRDGRLEMKLKE